MQKILISLPDDLAARMRVVIPNRQRSKIIAEILENELIKRERKLYECASEVETDEALNKEMLDWDITAGDGIEAETW